MKEIFPYIIGRLDESKIKYEVHTFQSGALMIDIRINHHFYVVQIENDQIGLSLITEENPGFDTIPDNSYNDMETFKVEFEKIL